MTNTKVEAMRLIDSVSTAIEEANFIINHTQNVDEIDAAMQRALSAVKEATVSATPMFARIRHMESASRACVAAISHLDAPWGEMTDQDDVDGHASTINSLALRLVGARKALEQWFGADASA